MDNFKHNLIWKNLSSFSMLGKVRQWLSEKAGATLTSFSKFVCKKCDFTDGRGQLQTSNCAVALKELDAKGKISLQESLKYTPRIGGKSHIPKCLDTPVPQPVGVPENVCDIADLRLVKVSQQSDHLLWNTIMRDEHYLGAALAPGLRIRYLVYSEHGLLGGVSFSPAAYHLKARDAWIGWTDETRQQNLGRVLNMSRFLIRQSVHCQNLASKVISLALKAVVNDCLQDYHFAPYLVEAFVDKEKFDGDCYEATDWDNIGLTQGRGRNDPHKTAQLSKKCIFVKPLVQNFREQLGVSPTANYPAWAIAGPLQVTEALPTETWADFEFSSSDLGHQDRNEALICSAEQIGKYPHFSANMAFKGDKAGSKRWYNFIASPHEAVNFSSILSGPEENTYRRMMSEKVVLLVVDTTKLNFTSKSQTANLGLIGRNQTNAESKGLILHTTMAVTPEGVALGIMKATCFTRKPKEEGSKERPFEERESYLWVDHALTAEEIGQYMPDTRLILVCDRGADFANFIFICAGMKHCDLIVRAKADRVLPEENRTLFQLMDEQNEAGRITITVPRQSQRPKLSGKPAVKKVEKRKAELKVSFCKVKIAPSPEMKGKAPIEVCAISAIEIDPPEGVKPVCWRLLTTLQVNSYEDAVQCIEHYTRRWTIEEFHRVLKTGCRVEYLAHRDAERIKRALAVYMVIAWRIMLLARFGRETPDLPPEVLLNDLEIHVLRKIFAKKKGVRTLKTLYDAIILIAKLGGYLDRKNDPPPGYEVFWKGYQVFQAMYEGALLCGLKPDSSVDAHST